MTGIASRNMASVPSWSHSSSSSSEEVDRLRTGSAWRREFGDRNKLSTDSAIMNGIRSSSDDIDGGSAAMDRQDGRSQSDSDNHIVSVHNNPFFKTYGIRTQRPDSRGEETSGREGSVTLRSVNIKENDSVFDEDEPHEYRPGSGFVHKLMGKFSSLTTREDNNYRPKRTSSLENLLDEQTKRDSSIKDDVPRRISGSLSKSVENVNSSGRQLRPLNVPSSSYRSSFDSGDKKSLKSPREGIEAPFLPRDDIIIIEKEPMDKPEPKTPQLPDSPGKFSGPQVISLKEESANIDELPKPNTVLSVRSIFEKAAPSAPMAIYSTATGPVVLSPTSNLKAPPFSSHKAVSKVTPSVSTESAQPNASNQSETKEKPKKRMAPKPPVQNRPPPEQKSTLPMPKPRSKQSPVIAVAPFVNESSSNDENMDTSKSNSVKKVNDDSGGIWPGDAVSKVFDSSAIIKPPVAPARSSKQYSSSTTNETNRSVSNSSTILDSEYKKENDQDTIVESKPVTNGTSSSSSTNSESSKPELSYSFNSTSSKSETTSRTSFVSPSWDSEKTSTEPEPVKKRPAPRIETNVHYDSKLEQIFPSEKPVSDLDTHLDLENIDDTPVEILPEHPEGPVKGIPRVIAERLKKDGNKTGHHQPSVVNNSASQEDNNTQSSMSKFEGDMVAARKRKNNTPLEEKTEPRDTTNDQILNFRKNLRSVSDSKSSKVSQVFDTSQIVRKPVNHNIPRLDLSGIGEDQRNGYYQEGYKPTEIKPCTIIFIGAGVKLGRSMLEKNRSTKGKITFSDSHNQTFEYPSEEVYLEDYLAAHPNEPAEILILEDLGSAMMESSDDADEPQTPRGGSSSESDDTLKSNTALSHSGGLSNYKSKYQMEYTFGSSMEEPETKPEPPPQQEEEEQNPQIVPAEEEITWSNETTSDLLF